MSGLGTGHQRIDERSLAMHRAIAEKLLANPELIGIAHENLNRWSERGDRRSQPYFDAWQELLQLSIADLAKRIVEPGERMTALRQTSPFAGVLTPSERWAIYAIFQTPRTLRP